MYTDLLATSPGGTHSCYYGSLVLAFTVAIPHHCSECAPIVVRGLVTLPLRRIEVFLLGTLLKEEQILSESYSMAISEDRVISEK